MTRKLLIALSVAAAFATGCQTVETTQSGVVGVDRQQHMLISSEQMNAGAEKAYADLLAQAKAKGALDSDPAQAQRVQAIVKRLIPQTAVFRKDAPGWKWEAHVIGTKDVNAFCMPGGKMAVFSGLIQSLNATDDELAAVMGHEIAHALREHSREQASQQAAQGIGLSVIGALAGLGDAGMSLSQMAMDVTFNLPHSRQDEQEADRIGVELAARAGYDPRAAIALWEKMQKLGGGQPPQILSTHPSNESRIADLKQYAEKVMPLYQQATAKR
ncbi:MAG TPA: M48 family metallopeptidase [Burkholderiales bacterium]|nr:M48 family metallopeptidase [Burkholderiales bacterium]